MGEAWHAATAWTEVCRRASGRRKYQSLRRFRAGLRQIAMATRLNELRREAWDRDGIPVWMPYGIKAQLAREFNVSYQTALADIKAIETWDEPTPSPPPDPRFGWAKERVAMSQRITVRLPDDVFERLAEAVKAEGTDVSDIVRKALLAHLHPMPASNCGPGSLQ